MSATEVRDASRDAAVGQVDTKLEIQVIPVSDVDRAKAFYEQLGWRLDDDVAPLDGLRIVQFTPPGSGTSITFGTRPDRGLARRRRGRARRLGHRSRPRRARGPRHRGQRHLARPAVSRRGTAARPRPATRELRVVLLLHRPRRQHLAGSGSHDPPARPHEPRPDRLTPPPRTSQAALRRAEAAHHEHDKRAGRSHLLHHSGEHEDWSVWYASYMVAEQTGTDLPG